MSSYKPIELSKSRIKRAYCNGCNLAIEDVKSVDLTTGPNSGQTISYCKDCAETVGLFLIRLWDNPAIPALEVLEEYDIYYHERDGIDPGDYIGTVKAGNKEDAIDKAALEYNVYGCDILARKKAPALEASRLATTSDLRHEHKKDDIAWALYLKKERELKKDV